jgi:hypothetical protein
MRDKIPTGRLFYTNKPLFETDNASFYQIPVSFTDTPFQKRELLRSSQCFLRVTPAYLARNTDCEAPF